MMSIIIDFIKSFLYYPTLKKYFKEHNYVGFTDGRLLYSIKHCRMKKKIQQIKNSDYSTWNCCYQQEPVIKNNGR